MAKTELHNYTVQEKLNKMDVDIIDVTATLDTSGAGSDVMFVGTEIPNCVSVKGGTALLHSVTAILANNATDTSSSGGDMTGGFSLVFTSDEIDSLALGDTLATQGTAHGSGGFQVLRAELAGTGAIVPVVSITDMGYFAVGYASNSGAVLKAASDSTSMFVWGIANSADNYAGGTITLRIGVVKD